MVGVGPIVRAMSKTPLPRLLDLRRAAGRSASIAGSVAVGQLERVRAAVSTGGEATASFRFWRDEQGRYRVDSACRAEVEVVCQRCLGPLAMVLEGSSALAAVWSEEQASQLPRELEPLLTGDETDLWAVLEEELLLVLPVAPMHAAGACDAPASVKATSDESRAEGHGEEQDNPFAVLESLRSADDGKTTE